MKDVWVRKIVRALEKADEKTMRRVYVVLVKLIELQEAGV